ncbi:unnamed protein product [Hapterophycus canaliculatus]
MGPSSPAALSSCSTESIYNRDAILGWICQIVSPGMCRSKPPAFREAATGKKRMLQTRTHHRRELCFRSRVSRTGTSQARLNVRLAKSLVVRSPPLRSPLRSLLKILETDPLCIFVVSPELLNVLVGFAVKPFVGCCSLRRCFCSFRRP